MLTWIVDKLLKRAETLEARQRELRGDDVASRIDAWMKEGYEHHVAGDIANAEAMYRKILFRDPSHPDALFLLGEIQQSKGCLDEAIGLIEKAIAANSAVGAFHASLANVRRLVNDLTGAEASYREAARLEPTNYEYLNDWGTVLQDMGRGDEAMACYDRALKICPDLPQALYNLGRIHFKQGRMDEAALFMERGIGLQPDYSAGYLELAKVFLAMNNEERALDCYRKALDEGDTTRLSKDQAVTAFWDYGSRLLGAHKAEEAVVRLRRALSLDPAEYGAWVTLGNAYKELKLFDEDLACQMEALRLMPSCSQAYSNVGATLKSMGDCVRAKDIYRAIGEMNSGVRWPTIDQGIAFCELDVALALTRHALSLNPAAADFHVNEGVILEEMGHFSEALACYEKALEIEPTMVQAQMNRGIALLRMGLFEPGWEGYEARLQLGQNSNPAHLRAAPLWNGEAMAQGGLLVHAEQGLGDTIQFIRYYEEVASRCRSVIVECQAPVKPLIESITGIANVYIEGEVLPPFDRQVPLLSLPRILATRKDTIPAPVPYVVADRSRVEHWQKRVAVAGSNFKVGLVWAGGAAYARDKFRSCSLSVFSPLADIDGLTFFSLQKGPSAQEWKAPPTGLDLLSFTDELHDMGDTAALIETLDLVISVDTAVAHLAGALGKPVWLILPFHADWRWMLEREDTPWYPTMRLFRQAAVGCWQFCLKRIREELIAHSRHSGSGAN